MLQGGIEVVPDFARRDAARRQQPRQGGRNLVFAPQRGRCLFVNRLELPAPPAEGARHAKSWGINGAQAASMGIMQGRAAHLVGGGGNFLQGAFRTALCSASWVIITMATPSPGARPRWIMLSIETPASDRLPAIEARTPGTSSTSKRRYQGDTEAPAGAGLSVASCPAGRPKAGRNVPAAASTMSGNHGGGRWAPRPRRCAGEEERSRRAGIDHDAIGGAPIDIGERAARPHHRRAHLLLDAVCGAAGNPQKLDAEAELGGEMNVGGGDLLNALHRHALAKVRRGTEHQAGKQRQLVRADVAAADIQGGIGLHAWPSFCASFSTSAKSAPVASI